MSKRQPVNTIAAAMRIAKAATRRISPPPEFPLDPEDMPFWRAVIEEFPRSEWTAHQLHLAAGLARELANLEREQRFLREEGSVMHTERGTPVVNPRKAIVQATTGAILSMRRSLSLHARAQGGEAREVGKRRKQARAIEVDARLGDDLIPGTTAIQ